MPESTTERLPLKEELANKFIAFLGLRKILDGLPLDKEPNDNSGEHGLYHDKIIELKLGSVCLHNIKPQEIAAMVDLLCECNSLTEEQTKTFNLIGLDLLSFKLQKHKELEGLQNSNKLPPQVELCDAGKTGAYWRNRFIDGKMIVTEREGAIDTNSTTGTIDLNGLKALMRVLPNTLIRDFVGLYNSLYPDNPKLTLPEPGQKQVALCLSVLANSNILACDIFDIANYVSEVLLKASKQQGECAIVRLLGYALPQLHMPRNSKRFHEALVEQAPKDDTSNPAEKLKDPENVKLYEKLLKSIASQCDGLRMRNSPNSSKPLDLNVLKENFEAMKGGQEGFFSLRESNEVNDYYCKLIRAYLDDFYDDTKYGTRYNALCDIEWDVLQSLFEMHVAKGGQQKSRSQRTFELFERHGGSLPRKSELSEEEKATIRLIDSDQLTPFDQQRLYHFFQDNRAVFDGNQYVLRFWHRAIFTEQKIGEDFCADLCSLMMDLMPDTDTNTSVDTRTESKRQLQRIALILDMRKDELKNLNPWAVSFFCFRYGPLLRWLASSSDFSFVLQRRSGLNAVDIKHPILRSLFALEVADAANTGSMAALESKYCFILGRAWAFRNVVVDQAELNQFYQELATQDLHSQNWIIKFELIAYYNNNESNPTKLEWAFKDSAVGVMTPLDAYSVAKSRQVQIGCFRHNILSAQGVIQNLSLNDTSTLDAWYESKRDGESNLHGLFFSSAPCAQNSVSQLFNSLISKMRLCLEGSQAKISADLGSALGEAHDVLTECEARFKAFEAAYLSVVVKLSQGAMDLMQVDDIVRKLSLLQVSLLHLSRVFEGAKAPMLLADCKAMLQLVASIGVAFIPHPESFNTILTKSLYHDINAVGEGAVESYKSIQGFNQQAFYYAIATPLSVEGIRSYARKLERVVAFVKSIFDNKLVVDDSSMLLDSFAHGFAYNDNAEMVINCRSTWMNGANAEQGGVHEHEAAKILVARQNRAGHTLYEDPEISKSVYTGENLGKRKPGRTSAKDQIIANTVDARVPFWVYEREVRTGIYWFLTDKGKSSDHCSILLLDCGIVQIPSLIYRILCDISANEKLKIDLIIVNQDESLTKAIYKTFESDCFASSHESAFSDFVRDVSVRIYSIPKDSIALEKGATVLSQLGVENGKVDLCLLFHNLDAKAQYQFGLPTPVAVAKDEVNYHPELITNVDATHPKEPSNFVVSPVQPLSKILALRVLYALMKDHGFEGQTGCGNGRVPVVPLFKRTLASTESTKDFIKKAHAFADVVMYFDALNAKQYLVDQGISVEYQTKIDWIDLNFIVARDDPNSVLKSKLEADFAFLGYSGDEKTRFIKWVLDDAILTAGNLVRRATHLTSRSHEMLGLVMSRFMAQAVLSYNQKQNFLGYQAVATRFLMIDDYMRYFTEHGNKSRADIFCLQVLKREAVDGNNSNGKKSQNYLMVLQVVESKYLSNKFFDENRKYHWYSIKQTMTTLSRIERALCAKREGKEGIVLDQEPMLNLCANMLLDGSGCSAKDLEGYLLSDLQEIAFVQQLVRDGAVEVLVQGCSFVFAYEREDANGAYVSRPDSNSAVLQIVFTKRGLQQVLAGYQSYKMTQGHKVSSELLASFFKKFLDSELTEGRKERVEEFLRQIL